MNLISVAQKIPGPKIDDFVPSIFIDSIVMANDLILGTDIKQVLNYQKEEGMPDIYKYDFKIRTDGRLEPGTLETDSIYTSINNFIKKKFNNYKWKSAYRKSCHKCKVISYGIFNISFITIENKVEFTITIFDGTVPEPISKVIYSKIVEL